MKQRKAPHSSVHDGTSTQEILEDRIRKRKWHLVGETCDRKGKETELEPAIIPTYVKLYSSL